MKIAKQRVEYVDHMGSDLSVVNAARVSFAKQSDWVYEGLERFRSEYDDKYLSEKDTKLISYLAKHGHWSPFAHNSISFRIKAPIFVARQLVKHQVGLVWNEVSRRYVDDEPEFYFPDKWRKRADNVKQGSGESFFGGGNEYQEIIAKNITEDCFLKYKTLLKNGVAPEQARMVLPQNTMTEWIWTGSLMAFARVCKQRLDSHAQQETQEVAAFIDGYCRNLFPVSWQALME